MAIAQRNIDHFDHAFKGELHTSQGTYFSKTFGECKFAKRTINIVCKSGGMDLIEDVGLSARSQMELKYMNVIFDRACLLYFLLRLGIFHIAGNRYSVGSLQF